MEDVTQFPAWAFWFQMIASIAAAVAAGASVWVAVLAPRRSAEEHSRLGVDAEKRRLKLAVFGAIMQDRPRLHGRDTARSLNLIDALYHDVPEVRDRWADLHHALTTGADWDSAKQAEVKTKTKDLLSAMALDLGLANELRSDDFQRIYFPNALADQLDLEFIQRKVALDEALERARKVEDAKKLKGPNA